MAQNNGTIICPSCGKENAPGSYICDSCFALLSVENFNTSVESAPAEPVDIFSGFGSDIGSADNELFTPVFGESSAPAAPAAPAFNAAPAAPTFNSAPAAPAFNAAPAAPTFNSAPTAPAFNAAPAAPTAPAGGNAYDFNNLSSSAPVQTPKAPAGGNAYDFSAPAQKAPAFDDKTVDFDFSELNAPAQAPAFDSTNIDFDFSSMNRPKASGTSNAAQASAFGSAGNAQPVKPANNASAFEPVAPVKPQNTEKSGVNSDLVFTKQKIEESEEEKSAFADGLPAWDMTPPQTTVRRSGNR